MKNSTIFWIAANSQNISLLSEVISLIILVITLILQYYNIIGIGLMSIIGLTVLFGLIGLNIFLTIIHNKDKHLRRRPKVLNRVKSKLCRD